MTYLILPLMVAGLALVVLEVFVPGFGVPGISGVICIIASALITALYVPFGYAYVLGGLVLMAFGLMALIRWAKSKQLYGSLILKEVLSSEKKELGNSDALIGKEGVAVVPLRPFGAVDFNGIRKEVFSEGAFVPKGRAVKVINVENDRIIVKEMN